MTLSGISEGSSVTSVLTAAAAEVAVGAVAVDVEAAAAADAVSVVVVDTCGVDAAAGGGAVSWTIAGVVGVVTAAVDAVVVESEVLGLTSPVIGTVAVVARLMADFPPLACFHSFKILLSKSTNSALILPVELLVPGTLPTLSLLLASTGVLTNPSNGAVHVRAAVVVCIMYSNDATMKI